MSRAGHLKLAMRSQLPIARLQGAQFVKYGDDLMVVHVQASLPSCCGTLMQRRRDRTATLDQPASKHDPNRYKITSAVWSCGKCKTVFAQPISWQTIGDDEPCLPNSQKASTRQASATSC